MVFQHFSLFDALTVAENVALALDGAEPVPRVAARLAEVSRAYGLPLDPRARSGGCRWASASASRSCAA
jgi:general nucleoside transport system ATP-binding protein